MFGHLFASKTLLVLLLTVSNWLAAVAKPIKLWADGNSTSLRNATHSSLANKWALTFHWKIELLINEPIVFKLTKILI